MTAVTVTKTSEDVFTIRDPNGELKLAVPYSADRFWVVKQDQLPKTLPKNNRKVQIGNILTKSDYVEFVQVAPKELHVHFTKTATEEVRGSVIKQIITDLRPQPAAQ